MPVDSVRLSFQGDGLWVLNLIIGLIMFGVALDLRWQDFARILRSPKGPLIGLAAQFVMLPAFTFVLVLILHPTPSIGLGMILIAACPGGNVSNFLTFLAKGNTAMSVTMTAISTVVAVVLTPLNLALWGSLNPDTAALLTAIRLDSTSIFQTILVILAVPTALGMSCAYLLPTVARRLHTPFKIFSIVAFLTFVVIAFSQNLDVFVKYVGWVAFAVFLHNGMALLIGYSAAWLCGLPEADRRAISIEVGIQNSALGLVLVFRYFDGLGGMALVAGWWGIWHIFSGLTVASIWACRPVPLSSDAEPV